MAYEVMISLSAENDIEEAVQWYEEQQTGLGIRFYERTTELMEKISLNPEFFSFIREDYRRITISPFPYNIIYKIFGSKVVVFAVSHHNRNPAELIKRIS